MGNHGAGDKSGYDDDSVHSPFKCGSVETPQAQPLDELNPPQFTDTSVPCPPLDDGRLADQMCTIAQQIGQQVADSIMSHLATSSPTSAMHTVNVKTSDNDDFTSGRTLDLSRVQLVTQREVKDPPAFRGESSDVLTVDEWETFRSKTIDKWSAREVQEVLDEYHLEKCVKSSKRESNRININAAEISHNAAPVSDTPELKKNMSQDNATLERLISMLEKVLLQSQAQANRNPNNNHRAPRIEGLTDTPCSVCKDGSHTALTHCRENRLCFLCHSAGHSRRTCPEGKHPPLRGQQGN